MEQKLISYQLNIRLRWFNNGAKYIPSQEKETFAHTYASKVGADLSTKGLIPFERVLDEKSLKRDGLRIADFIIN